MRVDLSVLLREYCRCLQSVEASEEIDRFDEAAFLIRYERGDLAEIYFLSHPVDYLDIPHRILFNEIFSFKIAVELAEQEIRLLAG